jgi:hypothetical protein
VSTDTVEVETAFTTVESTFAESAQQVESFVQTSFSFTELQEVKITDVTIAKVTNTFFIIKLFFISD